MEWLKVKLGNKVKYNDFPAHINPSAHKLWAAKVTEYNENKRYPIQLDWLPKTYIDDELHYIIDRLSKGDIIKVNAGSHQNSYPVYYKILTITEEKLEIESIKEEQVIEEFKNTDKSETITLRDNIISMVKVIENKEALKELQEQTKQIFKDKRVV